MISTRQFLEMIANLNLPTEQSSWQIIGDVLLDFDCIYDNEDDREKGHKDFLNLIQDAYKLQQTISNQAKNKTINETELKKITIILHAFISAHYFFQYHMANILEKNKVTRDTDFRTEILSRTFENINNIHNTAKSIAEKTKISETQLKNGRKTGLNPTTRATFGALKDVGNCTTWASEALQNPNQEKKDFTEEENKKIAACIADLNMDFKLSIIDLDRLLQNLENQYYADFIIDEIENAYTVHHNELSQRLGVPLQKRLENPSKMIDDEEIQKIIEIEQQLSSNASLRYTAAKTTLAEARNTLIEKKIIIRSNSTNEQKSTPVYQINTANLNEHKDDMEIKRKLHHATREYAKAASSDICEKFIKGISQRIINTALSQNDHWKVGIFGGVPIKIKVGNTIVTKKVPSHIARIYNHCNQAIQNKKWADDFVRLAAIGLVASQPHTSFLWLNKRDKKTTAFYNEFKDLHQSALNAQPGQMLGVIR